MADPVVQTEPGWLEEWSRLQGHIRNNAHRMDYPEYRRRGWDIGSGPTEAGRKIVGERLGGCGMEWGRENPSRVASLRALYPTHFAPATEDVPFYNGIHFMLNGVRGLLLPWVGSLLWVLLGPGAVLAAVVTSSSSIPIVLRAMRHGGDGARGDRKSGPEERR